jgi:hypothetical protein
MKRTWIFIALLMGILAGPGMGLARMAAPEMECLTELPWTTVEAVLKRCAALRSDLAYAELVSGYHAGLVDVATSGSGYLVTMASADGPLTVVIIDGM